MGSKKSVLLGLLVTVPALALTLGIKPVAGSEPPNRLVDNGDGTVTDTVTKLVWQQATNPQNYESNAASACAALMLPSKGLTVDAGGAGWRLPTIKELVSIVDFESATSPVIDTAAFPGTSPNFYWTGWVSGSQQYLVQFANGVITPTNSGYGSGFYRCVHSQ